MPIGIRGCYLHCAIVLVHTTPRNATYDFAADVRAGLFQTGQKELPSKYLYDDVGSALFEVISRLPEYGRDFDSRLRQLGSAELLALFSRSSTRVGGTL